MLRVIALNRDVDVPVFQQILTLMERDLANFEGMGKKELIDILQEPVGISVGSGS